ncbi:MAG: hypothetical protein HY700_07780 [Gemmatimonadetes bacterium]|nr:hypothetical protein [Gemmatimonadota bacterium]
MALSMLLVAPFFRSLLRAPRSALMSMLLVALGFPFPLRIPHSALAQGPSSLTVGRVTAVYWPGDERAARALAEMADRSGPWPAVPQASSRPIRLILADKTARFDSLTGGRVPPWSEAVAFPGANTVIVRLQGDPGRALRHELAHLALHAAVPSVPRWFDEGYAAWASGEWNRLDVLRVNWELARGKPPTLDQLNRDLEGGAGRAEAAYALAATAVQMLARIGGERGLEPIITALGRTPDMDAALRQTHRATLEQFEELWHQDLKRRYGWLSFLSSITMVWGLLAAALVVVWFWRRRRDRARREALDEGWEWPSDEAPPSA